MKKILLLVAFLVIEISADCTPIFCCMKNGQDETDYTSVSFMKSGCRNIENAREAFKKLLQETGQDSVRYIREEAELWYKFILLNDTLKIRPMK